MAFSSRAASLVLPLLLASVACDVASEPVQLARAVVVTPAGATQSMLFLTVENTSARPVRIVKITVEAAAVAEMRTTTAHRMAVADSAAGPTTMYSPVESLLLPARSSLRFAPGGYTVALGQLARPLLPGDSVAVTVWLETREQATTTAPVLRYADLDTALIGSSAGTTSIAGGTPVAVAPSIEEGRTIFTSDGCANCHGLTGHGDGAIAKTLNPPPRDFRVAAAFKNGTDEAAIAQTLATGIPNGGAMPLYAHLSERERRSLALYVISLRQTATEGPTP